jgi:dGTP triphosphohydrolase
VEGVEDMKNKGIKKFQQERYEIIIDLINQSCIILLKKGVDIIANSVAEEVVKLFKKENIDTTYLVSAQTIGRNKKYNSIWKKFQKKQKQTFLTKREKSNRELEFSIRDKYDMLKQDYIELNDQYTYLSKESEENIKKIEIFEQNISKENFNTNKKSTNDLPLEILISLKKLLINGSVAIVEKEDSIIIKNINLKDDHKIIIGKDKWHTI